MTAVPTAPGRVRALASAQIHSAGKNKSKQRDWCLYILFLLSNLCKSSSCPPPPLDTYKDQQLEAPYHCQSQHPRTCHLHCSLPFVLICQAFALIARLGQATVALCRTWRGKFYSLAAANAQMLQAGSRQGAKGLQKCCKALITFLQLFFNPHPHLLSSRGCQNDSCDQEIKAGGFQRKQSRDFKG